MTHPFGEPIDNVIGPGAGMPTAWTMPSTVTFPTSVFSSFVPKDPPTVYAVKLTAANFLQVVAELVRNSDESVHIPKGRKAITIAAFTYGVGQWIIRDGTRGIISYRRPLGDEVKTYGLVDE